MLISMFTDLINRVGVLIVLAFVLSKVGLFRQLVAKDKISYKNKFALAVFFALVGIFGTYSGIPIRNAIANSRVIGVFIGGLLGGPFVGFIAGLIAGFHRWVIDINGFTAIACGLSTLLEGILAGYLSKKFYNSEDKIFFAFISGMVAEVLQMVIIIIVAKPFIDAVNLVQIIGIPMIVTNSIGIAIFIGIIESIFKEEERAAAFQAQRALKIANRTLEHLRKGFNKESASEAAKIIYEMTSVKAVAITDTNKILAHIGHGEDHHRVGDDFKTVLTKEVIDKGRFRIAYQSSQIGCNCSRCKLKSAVIVPLKERNKVIGTLKLYKLRENSITQVDLELALGLASLFSTQIELSKLDEKSKLLAKAELKALQAQINPHFLFNAINTIVSLIRTDHMKARELLLHLGSYFRKNLYKSDNVVNINKEIEHIKSYLEIEKARFGDKLEVVFNIGNGTDCDLPPLILQPIVENAVKHGVTQKVKGGTVVIDIKNDDDDVVIINVSDNGEGIDKESLERLLNGDKNEESIGLVNVNKRLKNMYGEDYGLQIDSQKGKGTIVTMKIPKNMSYA